MRGAATAELLRCAERLRSVGAVDCDSNTTMLAHGGVSAAPWTARRAYPALPPTCREERGACTVRELSLVALRARRVHLGERQRVCTCGDRANRVGPRLLGPRG